MPSWSEIWREFWARIVPQTKNDLMKRKNVAFIQKGSLELMGLGEVLDTALVSILSWLEILLDCLLLHLSLLWYHHLEANVRNQELNIEGNPFSWSLG